MKAFEEIRFASFRIFPRLLGIRIREILSPSHALAVEVRGTIPAAFISRLSLSNSDAIRFLVPFQLQRQTSNSDLYSILQQLSI